MGYPRHLLVDSTVAGFYHCVSRCVRRAFLCGDSFEHRKAWIEKRLVELLGVFAIRSCAYAIMGNHLHLVLQIDPEAVRGWNKLEVARRWVTLYPKKLERVRASARSPEEAEAAVEHYIKSLTANPALIQELRKRLSDLGWFHKLLKEPIARRANHEDDCTGHFWEGRFKSYRLLDEAAILACTVYVDLNAWRARLVKALKESRFTSLVQRMKVLRAGARKRASRKPRQRHGRTPSLRKTIGDLLIPISTLFHMTTEQYVSLVTATARAWSVEVEHHDRLRSYGIDPTRWREVMSTTVKLFGSVVGDASSRLTEAERRGARHVVNALPIYEDG